MKVKINQLKRPRFAEVKPGQEFLTAAGTAHMRMRVADGSLHNAVRLSDGEPVKLLDDEVVRPCVATLTLDEVARPAAREDGSAATLPGDIDA